MSSRALRKLQKPNASHQQDEDHSAQLNSEDDMSDDLTIQKKANPFDLLEDEQDGGEDNGDVEIEENVSNKKSKSKKKHRKKIQQTGNTESPKPTDDIDACLEEVNRLLSQRDPVGLTCSSSCSPPSASLSPGLLNPDTKHLDPDNEMRRMFGSRVIQGQDRNNRGRQMKTLGGALVRPKPTWPPMVLKGLSMTSELDENGEQIFSFSHGPDYRRLQEHFFQAVESMNPDNIKALLATAPYHIDSLLQISEVFKVQEDMNVAAQLIEWALYAYQSAFSSSFSVSKNNCRLDFRRQESRGFYVALFRHIQFLARKACYRTCLEFCKVLLSLDPEGDPMGVLLMIDFYAIMCGEYRLLIQMHREWEVSKNLMLLPNFAFSVPLAKYLDATASGGSTDEADLLLQDSIFMFPGVLRPLLDKCNVNPDSRVTNASFFFAASQLCQSDSLTQVIDLYVARTFHCWQEPGVLRWLERNVHSALDLVDAKDKRIADYAEKRKRRYPKAPRNVLRHIFMSEIPNVTVNLSVDLQNERIMNYDPLPPKDTINIYTYERNQMTHPSNSNLLFAFLNSMLPNYGQDVEGAEGGGGVRGLVRGWLDLLRPLMDAPQEGPPRQHEGEDRADYEDYQEFD